MPYLARKAVLKLAWLLNPLAWLMWAIEAWAHDVLVSLARAMCSRSSRIRVRAVVPTAWRTCWM